MKAFTLLLFFVASIAASAATNRKEGDYSIIVTAESKGEAIAISIDLPQKPTWISYPPNFRFEKLTSATIEGENLSIPLQSAGLFSEGGGLIANGGDKIKILLPRSVIKGATLRLNFLVESTPNKIKTRDIALDTLVSQPSYTFAYWVLIAVTSISLVTIVVYKKMKKQNTPCEATGDNVSG